MKRHAPAAERNRRPILDALTPRLPERGLLLEVASGTGQHAIYLAEHLPHLEFQPSDADAQALESITAWVDEMRLPNVRTPVRLDAAAPTWPVTEADVVFCANMVHIAPWGAAEGLFRGAGQILKERGRLFVYGPFLVGGQPTTESNADFDRSLRARDPAWGLRDLSDIEQLAKQAGLLARERLDMPANNFLVVFDKLD